MQIEIVLISSILLFIYTNSVRDIVINNYSIPMPSSKIKVFLNFISIILFSLSMYIIYNKYITPKIPINNSNIEKLLLNHHIIVDQNFNVLPEIKMHFNDGYKIYTVRLCKKDQYQIAVPKSFKICPYGYKKVKPYIGPTLDLSKFKY